MNKPSESQIHSTLPLEGERGGGLLLASLIFFTRLPWWRLRTVPKEAFEHVVDWWPIVGWLTGGTMALTYLAAALLGFGPLAAAGLAIASRMLLTGGLHEDGLADFCDGFGGGTSRERTLSIMKDSHIGTYGVLGLILCIGLLWALMAHLPMTRLLPASLFRSVHHAAASWAFFSPLRWGCKGALLILFADVAAKCAASLITGQLPYARTAEGAKNQVVYVGRSLRGWLSHALRCVLALALPVALLTWTGYASLILLLPVPFIVELLLVRWMHRRLGGYTGDCCGALFLLCELSLYLAMPLLGHLL